MVFMGVYVKAIVVQRKGGQESLVQTILGLQEKFWEFGCGNAEQVYVLAKVVSSLGCFPGRPEPGHA